MCTCGSITVLMCSRNASFLPELVYFFCVVLHLEEAIQMFYGIYPYAKSTSPSDMNILHIAGYPKTTIIYRVFIMSDTMLSALHIFPS